MNNISKNDLHNLIRLGKQYDDVYVKELFKNIYENNYGKTNEINNEYINSAKHFIKKYGFDYEKKYDHLYTSYNIYKINHNNLLNKISRDDISDKIRTMSGGGEKEEKFVKLLVSLLTGVTGKIAQPVVHILAKLMKKIMPLILNSIKTPGVEHKPLLHPELVSAMTDVVVIILNNIVVLLKPTLINKRKHPQQYKLAMNASRDIIDEIQKDIIKTMKSIKYEQIALSDVDVTTQGGGCCKEKLCFSSQQASYIVKKNLNSSSQQGGGCCKEKLCFSSQQASYIVKKNLNSSSQQGGGSGGGGDELGTEPNTESDEDILQDIINLVKELKSK
uniref:Uncharacterized protein n=1 Tax=Mimivirus LCMiAC01 TaxID=2506608 RepID=A0A481YYU2_9VIRU|nr:MAG: hypothetical protein LCMiAC01_00220 [Mimivirus LCMiAC01]